MAYPQRTGKGGLLNKLFAFFNFTANPQYVSLYRLRAYICMCGTEFNLLYGDQKQSTARHVVVGELWGVREFLVTFDFPFKIQN